MGFLLLGALALIFGASFFGGSDDDSVPPPEEPDTDTGGGDDTAPGGDLITEIFGTDGDDTLAGSENDVVRGGRGDDVLTGTDNAILHGGPGEDTLTGGDDTQLLGGPSNDVIIASGNAVAEGEQADDILKLSENARGNGGLGDDTIEATDAARGEGGAGDDTLSAGGSATIYGQDGDDRLTLDGDAHGFGGEGRDWIEAGGNSQVDAGSGSDYMILDGAAAGRGGADSDEIEVSGSADGFGGAGGDSLYSSKTDDPGTAGDPRTLSGGAGDDYFFLEDNTQGAHRVVDGGAGDDTFSWTARDGGASFAGAPDEDYVPPVVLTGGTGADTYKVDGRAYDSTPENGNHFLGAITDFNPDEDALVIEGLGLEPTLYDIAGLERAQIVSNIRTEELAGRDAVDVIFDVGSANDPEGPQDTYTIRLEGLASLDPADAAISLGFGGLPTIGTSGDDVIETQTGTVATGAGDDAVTTANGGAGTMAFLGDGNDTLTTDEPLRYAMGGAGDDVITVTSPAEGEGTFMRVDLGAGEDIFTATDAGLSGYVISGDDGAADTLNVNSNFTLGIDSNDTVNLTVLPGDESPARIIMEEIVTVGGSPWWGQLDIDLNITLPDDWALGRDLEVKLLGDAQAGTTGYALDVRVGGQEVAFIDGLDFSGGYKVDNGTIETSNIRVI